MFSTSVFTWANCELFPRYEFYHVKVDSYTVEEKLEENYIMDLGKILAENFYL